MFGVFYYGQQYFGEAYVSSEVPPRQPTTYTDVYVPQNTTYIEGYE